MIQLPDRSCSLKGYQCFVFDCRGVLRGNSGVINHINQTFMLFVSPLKLLTFCGGKYLWLGCNVNWDLPRDGVWRVNNVVYLSWVIPLIQGVIVKKFTEIMTGDLQWHLLVALWMHFNRQNNMRTISRMTVNKSKWLCKRDILICKLASHYTCTKEYIDERK